MMQKQPDGIAALGAGTYVLAREIIAVHDGDRVAITQQVFQPWVTPLPRCWVLLRNGQAVPAYVRAKSVYRRWTEALREVEDQA